MKRVRRICLTRACAAVTLSVGLAGSIFAQANQPQPTSNTPQATGGANQNGAANPASPKPGANGGNTAGNVANPDNAGANGAPVGTTTNPYNYNGINQTPWFSNPSVRRELNLDDARYGQLNQGYGQAWNRYNKGQSALEPNQPSGRWSQQQQELSNAFHNDLSEHTNSAFTDPSAGPLQPALYAISWVLAFNDPAVQKNLNLNQDQAQQLNQLNRNWNLQMQNWATQYPNNPKAVEQNFNTSRPTYQQNLNSTLTPDQRSQWDAMIGTRFDFKPDFYFQNNPATGATVTPAPK